MAAERLVAPPYGGVAASGLGTLRGPSPARDFREVNVDTIGRTKPKPKPMRPPPPRPGD